MSFKGLIHELLGVPFNRDISTEGVMMRLHC